MSTVSNDPNAVAGIPASTRSGPLRALASSQFRIFWAASLLGIVSFMISTVSRGWLILDMTDSAFLVTAINAIGMLPTLVFSLFGGVIADRVNRKLVLITCDGSSSIIVILLMILVYTDTIQLWNLFALTMIHGTVFAISMPARATLVSNLVNHKDMASAIALFTSAFSVSQMVGPAMAGYLINSQGMSSPFLISGIMLMPAVILLLRLKIPGAENGNKYKDQPSVMQSIIQGLQYVLEHRVITGLILMGVATTVFAMPYQTLLPVFARDILDVGASGLGWLGGLAGVGAIIGSVTVASSSNTRFMKFLMIVGSIGLGLFLVLFAVSTNYIFSLVTIFCLGFLFQIFMTSNFTFVQLIAPDHVRGRVVSIRMIAFGLSPFGMILLGTGAESVGPGAAVAIAGLIALALILMIIIVVPSMRHVEMEVPE